MSLTTNISVSIPHSWAEKTQDRAEEKGFASRSEYIRDLIQQDLENDDETDINLTDAIDGNGTTEGRA